MNLIKAIVEATESKFVLQQRWKNGRWEELYSGLFSREDAQEFLDTSPETDVDVEERAISTDGKEILRPKKKATAQAHGKNVLARNAPPAVHRRNAEFFDKHL